MIRHRPFGSGDPYSDDPDQRRPTLPLAGETFAVGALAPPELDAVSVEWARPGGVMVVPAERGPLVGRSGGWSAAGDGHLSAAAGRTRRRGAVWTAHLPGLAAGDRGRYRFVGPRTRTRWFPVTAAAWSPDTARLTVSGPADRLVPGSVHVLVDADGPRRVRFTLTLHPDEHVVGFGERFDRVDQRGHQLDCVVYEQYRDQAATGRTYFPLPFAHVRGPAAAGFGIHVRTTRRVWFDVGASRTDELRVEAEVDDEPLELVVHTGTPAEVLAAFWNDTGTPTVQPEWVHRLWISGNEWNTQQRVDEVVGQHRELDIPFGVLVLEAWSDEATFRFFRDAQYTVHDDAAPHTAVDITYRTDGAWPDPAAMVADLHEHDVRVVLWQIPLQKMRPPPRGQAAADARRMIDAGYCVREADGRPHRNRGWWFPQALVPDFTNPDAAGWWQDTRRYLVEDYGVDGFKTDGGEHAWGHDLRYHDGTRGDVSNGLQPGRFAAVSGELLAQQGRAPVTFSRAGHVGAQVHGCHWAGDERSTWEALRASVTAGITAGASGILTWGFDLGGFSGEIPSAELYIRSAQVACFAPIMQYHSEFNFHRQPSRDRTPWNIAERTGRPEVVDLFRRLARAREHLVPYLTQQSRLSVASGRPLLRALFFDAPEDPACWNHPYQYLLGDDLLVMPILEPAATTVEGHLPDGQWCDLLTGAPRGPGRVRRDTPLPEVAVWVRQPAWERFAEVRSALRDGGIVRGRTSSNPQP